MQQVGRSRVRYPISLLIFFFSSHDPSSFAMALEFTHPRTEMSTKKCFRGVEHYRGVWMDC
jgi:hypothetical protein